MDRTQAEQQARAVAKKLSDRGMSHTFAVWVHPHVHWMVTARSLRSVVVVRSGPIEGMCYTLHWTVGESPSYAMWDVDEFVNEG